MNQFGEHNLLESYINAHTVPTLPNTLEICDVTSVLTQERSHTHVRSVVNASRILQIVLLTCAQCILLDKLHCTSALIVLTLLNMVQPSCDNIYVLTPERSHTHVKIVVNASNILHIVVFTCAQHTLLNKLHCISALIVLTLPNMVQALCGNTSVFTPESSHTHVGSVGSASHSLQVIADIYVQCIQRPHLINSIAIPVPAVSIFWSLQNNTCSIFKLIIIGMSFELFSCYIMHVECPCIAINFFVYFMIRLIQLCCLIILILLLMIQYDQLLFMHAVYYGRGQKRRSV